MAHLLFSIIVTNPVDMKKLLFLLFCLISFIEIQAQVNRWGNQPPVYNYSDADVRTPSLSGGIQVAVPTGSFAESYDGIPAGFGAQFLFNIRQTPFEWGIGFSWHSMGSLNEDIWVYEGTDVDCDDVYSRGSMSVKSNNYAYHGLFRFEPFKGTFQPYADLVGGMKSFSTKTEIEIKDTDDVEVNKLKPNFGLSYGWAVGAKYKLTDELAIELRFANMKGGATKFVDRNSIQIDDTGGFQYELISSTTDNLIFQAGVSLEF